MGDNAIFIDMLFAVLPSLFVGIVMAWWNKKQKARDEREENREHERVLAEHLRISLLMATAKLSYSTAIATKRGYANGEVEEGIEQYNEAMNAFKDFERELIAKKFTGGQ